MAGKDRTTPGAVELAEALETAPYGFDFFQVARYLERINKDKPRIGRSSRPVDDPIRFGQDPSLGFAPASIASYTPAKNGRTAKLNGYFFGLLGPNGPLPTHLTEYAYGRWHNDHDSTFAHFLDVFHHRMISLFYRAWANSRPVVSFDRPESDWFGSQLGAVLGIGMETLRNRDAMPDVAKLHYAGLLSCQTRHPAGLRGMIEDFFKLPARIVEFIGGWMDLPPDGCCRLGLSPETGTLGETAIAGTKVWGCQHKFRIVLGPLDLKAFQRLLPGGENLNRLIDMTRNYVGDGLDWDLNLVLKRDEVPATKLGESGQLGWSTWLGSRQTPDDADDLLLAAPAYRSRGSGG